ncbi:MAG: hypothetical protein HC786_00905 [Richelia sp. CSU_2_1]|nr:hypothetical protein [Richelia sp. CSU_2_1]
MRNAHLTDYSNSLLSEVQTRSITNYQLPITNPRDVPHITEKGYIYFTAFPRKKCRDTALLCP